MIDLEPPETAAPTREKSFADRDDRVASEGMRRPETQRCAEEQTGRQFPVVMVLCEKRDKIITAAKCLGRQAEVGRAEKALLSIEIIVPRIVYVTG